MTAFPINCLDNKNTGGMKVTKDICKDFIKKCQFY